MISVAAGANYQWLDADMANIEKAVANAKIVVMQLEIPLEIVARVAEIAVRHNVPLLLDPAPARPLSAELLRNTSILKPNQNEAGIVSGIEVSDKTSAVEAAKKLLEMGVRDAVVITLGSEGALLLQRGGKPEFYATPVVTAADCTAAGDAFTGALAFRLADNAALGEAVQFANHVAALSATRLGAQISLPTIEETNRFMESAKKN